MSVGSRGPEAEPVELPGSSPDAALLARLRAGEDDAYRELLRLYGSRLLAVARRVMRDETDAQDCLQDAFLSAFRSLADFEGKSRLGTWLHRIVVNACLARLRARKRRPEEPLDLQPPEFDRHGFRIGPTDMPPGNADELLEREEVRQQVRQGIESLPDGYRIVLVLRDIEELSTLETAKALGITTGATKVRLHRARLALRNRIESIRQ